MRPIPRLVLILNFCQDQYQEMSWYWKWFETNTKSLDNGHVWDQYQYQYQDVKPNENDWISGVAKTNVQPKTNKLISGKSDTPWDTPKPGLVMIFKGNFKSISHPVKKFEGLIMRCSQHFQGALMIFDLYKH